MKPLIAFRLDDIAPTMSWQRFDVFMGLFHKYNLCPLLGVIPDNQDPTLNIDSPHPNFWGFIRSLKERGWCIAQHGYQHLALTNHGGLLGLNAKSEFAGLSFNQQLARIAKGRVILTNEGLDTAIWMAPFHSYDTTSLEALAQAGFKYITDGLALRPYSKSGIKFIPCQMAIPRLVPFGVITVCIHANYATDSYIAALDHFIAKHRNYCIDFSEIMHVQLDDGFINSSTEKAMLLLRKFK